MSFIDTSSTTRINRIQFRLIDVRAAEPFITRLEALAREGKVCERFEQDAQNQTVTVYSRHEAHELAARLLAEAEALVEALRPLAKATTTTTTAKKKA